MSGLTMTANFLQECAEVCRGAVEVLSGRDSQDTATLRDAVTKCFFEVQQASYESRRYLPEEYPRFSPKPSAAGLSPAIMGDLRLCTHVLIRCWESCEDLFRVWFDEELWETYSIDSHAS
jgi:hypothetical protein